MRILFNSSIIKPLFDSSEKKLLMADIFGSDAGCFLGSAWNPETPYEKGITVEHNGEYYNSILENLNKEPPNEIYWYSLDPYGGPDKTPKYYTLIISNCTTDPEINGMWTLKQHAPGDPDQSQYSKQRDDGNYAALRTYIVTDNTRLAIYDSLWNALFFCQLSPTCRLATECSNSTPGKDGIALWYPLGC